VPGTNERRYFDFNATTPVDPRVAQAMIPALTEVFGNSSSIHGPGQDAKRVIEQARRQVGDLLGCSSKDVVFTSGGTEADNLAILGAVRADPRDKKHVITSALEHPAVLETCRWLEHEGVEVTVLESGADGVVSPESVAEALRPETVLVSIMTANNETGVVQPIREIARLAHEAGALMHTDAVQATGKIAIDVEESGVDLLALSGHKFYGPKGVGALYVRPGTKLAKVQLGGTHERGLRPGTMNTAAIVGLGKAAELAREDLEADAARLSQLRDKLESGVRERVGDVWVNCAESERVPNTANIGFEGVEGEPLLIALDLKGVAVSSGAACSSGAVEPSHVLVGLGLPKHRARSCLRFSLGRMTTEEDVDALLELLPEAAARLRKLAPAKAR